MKTLLLSLALLVTCPAWAEWVLVGGSKEAFAYIDSTTIRRDGNLRKVWVLFDKKQRDAYGNLSARMRNEYDCSQEKYRNLTFTAFFEPMGDGKIGYSDSSISQWTDIAPGTIDNTILRFVCTQ